MGADKTGRESIFAIMDNIMREVGKTKKMFLVMVLTILILPPAGLLITTSVFDNPFFPDRKYMEAYREWVNINHQLRNMLLEIESLPPELWEGQLEETLASGEYAALSLRVQELSEQYPQLEENPPPKQKLLTKPLPLIVFVISAIWLGIGIRQWYVMSRWDLKYKQFKKQQEEIDKKLDAEPEGGD